MQNKKESVGLTSSEQAELDDMLRAYDVKLDHTRRLLEMGIGVITGSDSSWGDYQLGNTVNETECLVDAGFSPMQGVVSVTSQAARALDVDSIVGTLEVGKQADLLIVDGDPSQDINALWNVDEVFFAGDRLDRGSAESRAKTRQPRPSSGP